MLSDFVTRDGTDYGLIEAETPTKIEEVFSKISRGEAHIIFDPDSETFTIVSKEALKPSLSIGGSHESKITAQRSLTH